MTDRIREQLSAFLDGELPEPESALLLKRLERDDELRGALSRYSLIGAVLRSEGDVPAARQVAARVSAAIAREPLRAAIALGPGDGRALARTLAGLGIAASVAAAAVLLAPPFGSPAGGERLAAVEERAESPAPPVVELPAVAEEPDPGYVTPPAAGMPGALPPAEFANYLVAHYGYASPLVRRSVVAGLIAGPLTDATEGADPPAAVP